MKKILRKPRKQSENQGSCDFQCTYCEIVSVKILHWEVAGKVQKMIQNWEKAILVMLEIL